MKSLLSPLTRSQKNRASSSSGSALTISIKYNQSLDISSPLHLYLTNLLFLLCFVFSYKILFHVSLVFLKFLKICFLSITERAENYSVSGDTNDVRTLYGSRQTRTNLRNTLNFHTRIS